MTSDNLDTTAWINKYISNQNQWYAPDTGHSNVVVNNTQKRWRPISGVHEPIADYHDHIHSPLDPVYICSKLKGVKVLEYIIKNNYNLLWEYTSASTWYSC